MNRFLLLLLSLLAVFAGGCQEDSFTFDPGKAISAEVSGEKAFAHVSALVKFGPRPTGSDALEKSRAYLESELASTGWVVRRQTFTTDTPIGKREFTNLRARFGEPAWTETVSGLLCSHYDTKQYKTLEFVGANDGGSSTGLLVELARVLAMNPAAAQEIELVFFDGEEAFGTNITSKDGLFGSKYYAAQWLLEKERQRPRWGVLLDMIGDANLNIRAAAMIPRSSLRELASTKGQSGYVVDIESVEHNLQGISRHLLSAAADLDLRSHVGVSSDYIIDDHIPLNVVAGIPTIDLIDFDYPDWHTPGDTLDKISAESLAITGRVTLHLVEKYLLPGK